MPIVRKSNLVPTDLSNFDHQTGLSRSKIFLPEDKDVALVYLNWSQTNQFGNTEIVIPMVADPLQALDPVFHLRKLFSTCDLLPAFSFIKRGRINCVTYTKFTEDLKKLLDKAGNLTVTNGIYS